MSDDLRDLRRRLRALRRDVAPAERRRAASAVVHRLMEWPIFTAASRIAAYWACDGELEPRPLLERVWAAGRCLYLPVLSDASLRFAPYHPDTPLRRNRFNIPEPDMPSTECLEPAELDLVISPLVAFDASGNRLGMGGGFYDRSFAFLRDPHYRGRRPCLLGLGYEFQKVAELPRQPWDVPLGAAVTEAALYLFSPESLTATVQK